ncbi:UDP-glucuronate decarboxylase [Mycobacterium frederiksbergense]|uniref:UDP-glucuronate decarboxylase n=1 Tax=Mycolicibacterium frederiksbergense TaxID=117567 RepID=A0ABT6KZW5_9MYCO|nr:NAD-dependent epimerase/dehydratase family protein [Mycolicibacterium frederiksbergense]MDH6196242.1 UDP-glucuronate decarboxylase [Mycolicibacterium frederiksbergense]
MQSSDEVVAKDLDSICRRLDGEFGRMAGSSLLITGGAGFLGYYFVHAVHHHNRNSQQQDWISLTVFDNYVRGVPNWTKELDGDCGVNFYPYDLALPLPDDMGDFEYIIHAASIASPNYYRQRPIETMDSNVNGLRALLDHFYRQQRDSKRVGGFLFMSSSEIYGDPAAEWIPTPETYRGYVSCTGPRACYDEAKRYGETLCVNFAQQYGLPIRAARPFNNYGPGLKITDRRVLPDFARNILADQDVSILSDGTPMRTFCYVSDAIVGYYKALVRGGVGEAYNVGTETPEISMADLGHMMVAAAGDLFGYKGTVVTGQTADKDYLVDNPNRRCPDISKARKQLDYDPIVPLEDGLRRLLLWYAANPEGEDA